MTTQVPDPDPSQASIVRTYIAARAAADEAKAAYDAAKAEVDRAEQAVLDMYAQNGIQSIRVDGRLVSLTRTLRARINVPDQPVAAELLRAHGLDFLVGTTINASTLTSWVREQDAEGRSIPEDLGEYVHVAEQFGLSLRKA